MSYSYLCLYFAIATVVQGALQETPPCPRKRGLSEGLTWARNRIQKRPLYKLNARRVLHGFDPEETYRLRVHTTYLRRKFDDAQVFLEALDERCGAGSFVLDNPNFFTPKGCPDIIATQTKEPMGRADVFWKAPPCGCVNIRVRIHSDGRYFLDDEGTESGPLSKQVCPKDENLWKFPERYQETVNTDLTKTSRNQKLDSLCAVTREMDSFAVAKSESFAARRNIHQLTQFERELLETALELRSINTEHCCSMEDSLSIECFGDLRRRRIDKFCGSGETGIPLTTARKEWITERKSQCCWQIGEDRYDCFNYTLYKEAMLRDGRAAENYDNEVSLDEFDPANDLEDYTTENTTEEVEEPETTTQKMDYNESAIDNSHAQSKHTNGENEEHDEIEEDNQDKNKSQETGGYDNEDKSQEVRKDFDEDKSQETDEDLDESPETDEDLDENKSHEESDDLEDSAEEDGGKSWQIDRNKNFTKEECCYRGITAGITVEKEGLPGCFRVADIFSSVFNKWNMKCDRRFVVCCMRVVDGHRRVRHSKSRKKSFKSYTNDLDYIDDLLSVSKANTSIFKLKMIMPKELNKHGSFRANGTLLEKLHGASAFTTERNWTLLKSLLTFILFVVLIIIFILSFRVLKLYVI